MLRVLGVLLGWLVLFSGTSRPARADPERTLREAVDGLAQSSYRWETTVRQRFRAQSTEPRLDPRAPLAVEGRVDPKSYAMITLLPTRELAVPVTAVSRFGDVVTQTPAGWLRRSEVRQGTADREVTFAGKPVRAARLTAAALQVSALRPFSEELLDLVPDFKRCTSAQGLILAELNDAAIERLWGDAQAKRAPEVHGTVIFKLAETGIAEMHVVLGIGFPDSRTKSVAWSIQQWSTRIHDIGTTTVEPPAGAVAQLEQ